MKDPILAQLARDRKVKSLENDLETARLAMAGDEPARKFMMDVFELDSDAEFRGFFTAMSIAVHTLRAN